MKRAALGAFGGVGLVMVAMAVAQQHGDPFASRTTMPPPATGAAATAPAAVGSELIVVPMGDKGLLTVVDPRQRAICVYRIDPATGKLALKSARCIQWDLQIMDLNNENPTPQQIRSLLEQR
jgi:hypothetical protein